MYIYIYSGWSCLEFLEHLRVKQHKPIGVLVFASLMQEWDGLIPSQRKGIVHELQP